MPKQLQMIAAIGVKTFGPLLSGGSGDIGFLCYLSAALFSVHVMFSFFCHRSHIPKLDNERILHFFIHLLAPLLSPFPGLQSIVIMDNYFNFLEVSVADTILI